MCIIYDYVQDKGEIYCKNIAKTLLDPGLHGLLPLLYQYLTYQSPYVLGEKHSQYFLSTNILRRKKEIWGSSSSQKNII